MPRPRSITDDQILAATVTAIGRHGPARLTLAHIADEAGVSPAALIQRFGSKAALLAAVATHGSERAEAVFDDAAARSATPLAALREALMDLAGSIGDRSEFANHMAMLQLDLTDPELHQRAADQAAVVRRRIEALLVEAAAAGHLACAHTTRLADSVYTAYNGAMLTWAIDGAGALDAWVRARVDAVTDPYRTS